MNPGKEQREATRIPIQNKVKVMGRGRLAMYAIAINLSTGGVLLSATPSLAVGSVCEVTIFDGGSHDVLTRGTVVRSDSLGTAIRFVETLPSAACQALVDDASHPLMSSVLGQYLAYFQVGRNQDNAGCENLLGVSKATFRKVFNATFYSTIPLSMVPVWFLRGSFQAFPVWERIAACFLYGGLLLLVLQPLLDLSILHVLRRRNGTRLMAGARGSSR